MPAGLNHVKHQVETCTCTVVCLSSVTYVLSLNGASYRKSVKQIGNGLWGIVWSRDRWRHV